MRDLPETPDERLRRRQIRRWKRRARIVGPFLGVPILLVALSLSVDLIEYRPQVPQEKLTNRPIRLAPKDTTLSPSFARPSLPAPAQPTPSTPPEVSPTDSDETALNVMLPSSTSSTSFASTPPQSQASALAAMRMLPRPTPPASVGGQP